MGLLLTLFTDREETITFGFSVEIYNHVYLSKIISVTSFKSELLQLSDYIVILLQTTWILQNEKTM